MMTGTIFFASCNAARTSRPFIKGRLKSRIRISYLVSDILPAIDRPSLITSIKASGIWLLKDLKIRSRWSWLSSASKILNSSFSALSFLFLARVFLQMERAVYSGPVIFYRPDLFDIITELDRFHDKTIGPKLVTRFHLFGPV